MQVDLIRFIASQREKMREKIKPTVNKQSFKYIYKHYTYYKYGKVHFVSKFNFRVSI